MVVGKEMGVVEQGETPLGHGGAQPGTDVTQTGPTSVHVGRDQTRGYARLLF